MGKFFLMKDDMKGQHYAMYKKEKQYLYLQALFDDHMALYTALFYCNEKETEPYCFKTTMYPIYQIVKKFKEIYNIDFLTIMYEV